ncbi:MAG TPA: SdiA-regulated domain-containing protein [Thermoanaerobaculia bacterium]|nr:SdiA-regulated domain-containing protein [Thermoanaerobaculia bacterium]
MIRISTLSALAIGAALLLGISAVQPALATPPQVTLLAASNISNNFSPAFREASGLGMAKNETKMWSISDENFTIYKMNLDGSAASSFVPTRANSGVSIVSNPDFEGVTFGPPIAGSTDDHFIYLVNEAANAILPVNYSTGKYYNQVPLSSMSGYNSVTCDGNGTTVKSEFDSSDPNSGLEGITWDGSSFFVIKEKGPGLMIKISANLSTITACKVLTFSGQDYSDISYDSTRQRFWIVSDEASSLYLFDWNTNTSEHTYPLGYTNGEGVAFNPDDQGHQMLYIATDNGSSSDSYLYTYIVH